MKDYERMVLSDAIKTAVESEKKVIRQRRVIIFLTVALASVIGGVILGQKFTERFLVLR